MKNEQLCTKVHPGRVRDPWEQEPLRRVPGVRLSCLMVKISSATPKMPLQPSAKIKSSFHHWMDPEGTSTALLS